MSGCNCARGQVADIMTCDGRMWTGTARLFGTVKGMGIADWLPGGEWIHPDNPVEDMVAFYNERVCPGVPPMFAEGSSILPLVLIGGAVGGLFLLARKKRGY